MNMPPTPELDKLSALGDARAHVQGFLDWLLDTERIQLTRWRDDLTDERSCNGTAEDRCRDGQALNRRGAPVGDCSRCGGSGWVTVSMPEDYFPDGRTPEQLMADHFGIDLAKIDAEKGAILAAYRAAAGVQ